MAVLPRTRNEQLVFMKNHKARWIARAATLGLTPEETAGFNDLVDDALAERQAATDAKAEATAKLEDSYRATDAAVKRCRTLLKKIEATASDATDPGSIYSAAEIPAPKDPAPRQAPPAPYALRGSIGNNAAITVTWKLDAPAPDIYDIQRREIGADNTVTPFTTIGGPLERSFVDRGVGPGVRGATYRVRGRVNGRGGGSTGRIGEWSEPMTVLLVAAEETPEAAAPTGQQAGGGAAS